MAGLLLPEGLPTMLLSSIAHLYHCSYRMWEYLPTTYSSVNLSQLTSRDKEAVEIITILNCCQKCTIGVAVSTILSRLRITSSCLNSQIADIRVVGTTEVDW